MERPSSISVFFPAYNDGGTIGSMVITAAQVLAEIGCEHEIIVINDGSSDHTQAVLDELVTKYPQLRVVRHEQNRGYGGALRSGFASATKDLVFYTDGDAQYDPRELVDLLAAWSDEVDVVNGYKIGRSDPLHRIVIGRIYHWTVRIAFNLRLRDVDCDFRLLRRSIFERVRLETDSGAICLELMKKIQNAGYRVVQVPVHHYHRTYGRSQFFNVRRVARVGVDLARLWWKLMVPRPSGYSRAWSDGAR
jgi:glycosyltransferase involved in cell wall biosynthesis